MEVGGNVKISVTKKILPLNMMTLTERHIIDSYSKLFEGLNSSTKIELIEKLTKSLKKEKKSKETDFYKSFGAFESDKSAKEMIKEIRESRKFRTKDLNF